MALCLVFGLSAISPTFSAGPMRRLAAAPPSTENEATQLRPAISNEKQPVTNKLEDIAREAEETEGALFVKDDQVVVKAPMLKALIQLHRGMSPYDLDADGSRQVSLHDVLTEVLQNNLDIKISTADYQSSKWLFRSSLGAFLPDLDNSFSYQTISGRYNSPFGLSSPIGSPYMVIPSLISWTFFGGGANIFNARKTWHEYKAKKSGYDKYVNDVLTDATRLYYDLVLQDVLLQIRIKAVETSEALVAKNQVQYQFGANTQLDLLQAQTQLANDRQSLISQQVARRKSAVALARLLNADTGEDLALKNRVLMKTRLVDDDAKITDLVQIAIDNRPELKKWEQERLAAKDAIKVAFAPLLPQVIGSAGLATTGARVVSTSSGAAAASSAGTGAFGIGGFSTSTVASQGQTNGGKKFSLAEIYLIGISLNWKIGGLGVTDTAKVQSAKWQARKAQLEFARELTFVCRGVRDAYLDSIDAENLIAATSDAVNSSREQLRVATIRLEESVGTDLDVVQAQHHYTDALINKANAIVKFNAAQAELLRTMGRISVDTLTTNKPIFR
jgi:OMF family outer membrane factor